MRLFLPSSRSFAPLLIAGVLLLLSSCGGKKATVSESSGKGRTELSVDMRGLSEKRRKVVKEAYTWIGTPYSYACAEKGCGTDCSGMVLRVYETACGVKLPRNSAKQAEFCRKINRKEVKSGDLVFFATGMDTKKVSHVGIMVDEVSFIHSSSTKGVCLSKVTTPYYTRTLIQFGRVPGV